MPNLYDYQRQDYAALLASTVLDASKGVLYQAQGLKPDDTNRTILIGVGGTGVRTIDYVKGAISKRLDASWKRYIGFLGVDASWTEYDGASYLDQTEQVIITKDGVAARMSSPATFPAGVRRFMPKDARLSNLGGDGAGRTRLQGKLKVHDCASGDETGVDGEIVQALSVLAQNLDQITAEQGKYQVYVIGSVCGGTCSGSFLEMPALIRKAFNNSNRLSINAILYLPDTLSQLDPANATQLYANGYASLKELNYYMGMFMRPEYTETWSTNSRSDNFQLTHKSSIMEEGFIHVPYLVGTPSGPYPGASDVAKETIAEFLISTLAKLTNADGTGMFLTSAFDSNARNAARIGFKLADPGNPHKEAAGEYHEYPKRFAAIGFAEAAAPQKLVRAYTVGKVCTAAGIKPVDPQTRAATPTNAIVPFRGPDDLMSATEGTTKAEELLKPLASIMGTIHSGSFNFGQDLDQQDITWRKVHDGVYDNPAIAMQVDNVVKNNTGSKAMELLKDKIKAAYTEFRKNVQKFVKEEGPYSFYNLYIGRFTLVDGKPGRGIADMLINLVDGNLMNGNPYTKWITEETAKTTLTQIRQRIADGNPLNIFDIGTKNQLCAQWVEAYNNWGKARINAVRRQTALGPNGALHDYFQMPAAKLAKEVEAFGILLESMVGIYQNHGKKMETYEDFRTAQDKKTEVNLAAVNVHSYTWLLEQANASLANADARKLRDTLVDDFFGYDDQGNANSTQWLDVPKKLIAKNPVTQMISLVVPDLAVPGRQKFDQILAKSFPESITVSIETMFDQLAGEGTSYDDTAHEVMRQLYSRSKPQFNGTIPAESIFGFIMYPNALRTGTGNGPAIAAALEKAAKTVSGSKVGIYASDDTDSIVFYQLAAPMELYRLRDLQLWESHYENGTYGINNSVSYLHGMSPDVEVHSEIGAGTTYTEGISWADYPPVAPIAGDPRAKDAMGQISREGQYLLEMDKTIKAAKKLGILYCEKTAKGYVINRVFCNTVTENWEFSLGGCDPDENTGLLPVGKALAETVASQNGKSLKEISRRVRLEFGGLMDAEHPTEALAWEFATRTLRHHMPMYIEVCKTLKLFEVWAKDIEAYNKTILESLQPAKLVHMLRGGTLFRSEDGSWSYKDGDKVKRILNMKMLTLLTPKEQNMIKNGLLYYYLFTKLDKAMGGAEAWDKALEAAKDNFAALVDDEDMDTLEAGQKLMADLEAERAAIAEKGARLDGDAKAQPKTAFVKNMGSMFKAEELVEMDLFYHRTSLWEIV